MSVNIGDLHKYVEDHMSSFSTYMEDQMVAFLRANNLVPGDMRVTVTRDIPSMKFEYRIEVDDNSRSRKLLEALKEIAEHPAGDLCGECFAKIQIAEKAIKEYERGQVPGM